MFPTKPSYKLSENTNIGFKCENDKTVDLTALDKLHYFFSCHDSPAVCFTCFFNCLGLCLTSFMNRLSGCRSWYYQNLQKFSRLISHSAVQPSIVNLLYMHIFHICPFLPLLPSCTNCNEKWEPQNPAIQETFLPICLWYIMYFSSFNICLLLTTCLKHRPKHPVIYPFTIAGVACLRVKYFGIEVLSSLPWVPIRP
jgi:hypothetical protein